MKKRAKQCPVAAYLLLLSNTPLVSVFISDEQTHIHENPRKEVMTDDTMKTIKDLIDSRVKEPTDIKKIFKKQSGQRVYNKPDQKAMKDLKQPEKLIDYGALINQLQQLTVNPTDIHQPFVLSYAVDAKYLLGQAKRFNFVQIDVTFKLNWENYSILVIGKYHTPYISVYKCKLPTLGKSNNTRFLGLCTEIYGTFYIKLS